MQHATKRETIITITRDAFSTNDVRPFVTLRSFVPCSQTKKPKQLSHPVEVNVQSKANRRRMENVLSFFCDCSRARRVDCIGMYRNVSVTGRTEL